MSKSVECPRCLKKYVLKAEMAGIASGAAGATMAAVVFFFFVTLSMQGCGKPDDGGGRVADGRGPAADGGSGPRGDTGRHAPEAPGAEVTDRNDPNFYKQNLADIKSKDSRRCGNALRRLAYVEPKELRDEIVAALRDLLENGPVYHRPDVLRALGQWGGPEIVDDVLPLLDDKNILISRAAVDALAKTKDARAAEALAAKLGEPLGPKTNLQQMGPVAEDAVLKRLDPANSDVCKEACEVLGEVGTEKSLPKLKELARHDDFGIRFSAQQALDRMIQRSKAAARTGTGKPPIASDPISEALLKLEQTEDSAAHAALALAKLKVDPKRHAEVSAALVKLLVKTEDVSNKGWVLEALAVWHTPEAVTEMIKCLDHESYSVRSDAYRALGRVRTVEAAKACADRITGEDQFHAVRALKAMGPVAEDVALDLLRSSDNTTRARACEILGSIGTRSNCMDQLMRLTKDEDSSVRKAATRAVQLIGAREKHRARKKP